MNRVRFALLNLLAIATALLVLAYLPLPRPVEAGRQASPSVLDRFLYLPLVTKYFQALEYPGGRIVFRSDRDLTFKGEIYVMLPDGSAQTRLTSFAMISDNPAWSPDQRQIVFQSDWMDQNNEIYKMNSDGTNVVRLTTTVNPKADDLYPSWSPDGTHIAFASNRDGDYEIFIMNADGSGVSQLTHNDQPDYMPRWSPSGNEFVFVCANDICTMNANGTAVANLTNAQANVNSFPNWSPSGLRIVFSSVRSGNRDIFVINRDGSGEQNLTNNPAGDNGPVWSPDGAHIAFASDRDESHNEIWVMDADGNNVLRRTTNDAFEGGPDW